MNEFGQKCTVGSYKIGAGLGGRTPRVKCAVHPPWVSFPSFAVGVVLLVTRLVAASFVNNAYIYMYMHAYIHACMLTYIHTCMHKYIHIK